MKQAIVLAAGEGRRLRPFTVKKPKAMLAVAGRPILSYVIEALTRNGIHNIVIVAGHCKESIFNYFGGGEDFGVEITYINQDKQLGTAYALKQAQPVVEKEFLLLSGDKLIEPDTIASFLTVAPPALLVTKTTNPARYGVVTLENGALKNIVEKPQEAKSNIVSTGIYIFSQKIFQFIDDELDIPAVLNRLVASEHTIKTRETDGTWLDTVYPWNLISLNDTILRRLSHRLEGKIEKNVSIQEPVTVGKNTAIKSNCVIAGPAVIGSNCSIGPFVSIEKASSIGDNVVVSPFCHISNSVIGHDVTIGPGCIIENSVIASGCQIAGRFTAISDEAEIKIEDSYHSVEKIGTMLGEGCRIGSSVVAQPGTIIGNLCQVAAGNVVSGRIPDGSRVI